MKARPVCKVWHVNKGDGSILLFLALFFCLLSVTSSYAWPFGSRAKHSNHISRKPPKSDRIAPIGHILINNRQRFTNSNQVNLSLSVRDNPAGSGLSQMQFSNDRHTWSTPETYTTKKTWALSSGDGRKVVYTKFSDKAGNWSRSYSAIIILDTQGPALEITSPQEGQLVTE